MSTPLQTTAYPVSVVPMFAQRVIGMVVRTTMESAAQDTAVRLRGNKKVQNLNEMWYKELAKHLATQGDFGLEPP